jgi:hypothetical protein
MAKVERQETVRKDSEAHAAYLCGQPKWGFSVYFTLRIPAIYTVGAVLVVLVGHRSENGYRSPETADHPGQSHNNDDKPLR